MKQARWYSPPTPHHDDEDGSYRLVITDPFDATTPLIAQVYALDAADLVAAAPALLAALEWIGHATDAGESDPEEMASLLATISTVALSAIVETKGTK